MKLINETAYPTRKLRRMLVVVHDRMAREGLLRLKTWDKLNIWVVYSAQFGGAATYDGTWMVLKLQTGGHSTARIAKLMDHELRHSHGFTHRQMPRYLNQSASEFAWVEELFGPVLDDGTKPGCQMAHRLRDIEDMQSEGPNFSSRLLASAQGGIEERPPDRPVEQAARGGRR